MGADLYEPTSRLRVMNCDASVLVNPGTADEQALTRFAAERLGELERRWSRFVRSSEVSRLNGANGRPCLVSADTVRLVTALVQAWHATAGSFDPTLLGTIVELGYAASREDATKRTSLAPDVAAQGRPAAVLVDAENGVVQLPPATAIDPGGLGKGLAADIVVGELLGRGAAGALVEVGGDVRVAGISPTASAWAVAVRPPFGGGHDPVLVDLADGGVATSSSRLRTWHRDGRQFHHLLDPATHRPADHGVVACTVIAGSAAWAEAFTKVAFAACPADALRVFEHRSLAARLTTDAGHHLTSSAWTEYER